MNSRTVDSGDKFSGRYGDYIVAMATHYRSHVEVTLIPDTSSDSPGPEQFSTVLFK